MIRIRSKRPGFRRCGIAHPAEWTEYSDDRFTDEQLERLKAESMLQIERVEDGGPQNDGGSQDDGGPLTEDREFVEPDDPVVPVTPIEPESDNDSAELVAGRQTGKPENGQPLEDLTKAELIAMLEEKGVIDISSKVRKDQLIKMLRTTEDGGPKTV